ncbi:MAG: antitoxin, partial [Enterocloster aldenensis]
PESYAGIFEALVPEFRSIMEEHGYRAMDIEVERMDHVRSLMEVFKNLPFKRTGVDVKI